MKKLLLLLTTLLLLPFPALAGSTFSGDEGFINTPSSEVIGDRRINLGMSYLPGDRSYIFLGKPNLIYSVALGFIPRTEIVLIYNQVFGWVTPDNPYLKDSAFDRSINLKFQVLDEGEYIPSLAIGGRDLLSNAMINPRGPLTGNSFQQILYIAAGKTFYDFRVNLGYSYAPAIPFGFNPDQRTVDWINQSFRVRGFFGAIETPKFFSLVSAIVEYDSKQINYGLDIGPLYNLQAKLAMVDLKYFNFRINLSSKL
jgi:hypothetical protein